MKLITLHAQNFRNLSKLELDFEKSIHPVGYKSSNGVSAVGKLSNGVNAFVGKNAQGKTNILESISLLAFGKSLRVSSEKSLTKIGTDFFRVEGMGENSEGEKVKIEVAATGKQKVFKLNNKKITASKLIGNLPIVSFSPEDLNLLLLSPSLRRRYLDILLSQTSNKYLLALSGYAKALKQRNALLTRIQEGAAKITELDFWDQELAEHGSLIGKARHDFLSFAAEPLAENFKQISSEEKQLNCKIINFKGSSITPEKYLENLTKMREKDVRYENTNYGVHRADLMFELDNELLSENGSRGEIRSTILVLKFVELQFIEEQCDEKPILLLDDVFSELDTSRQKSLMHMIDQHQTFLTTTKQSHLDVIAEKDVWEVKDGEVEKI